MIAPITRLASAHTPDSPDKEMYMFDFPFDVMTERREVQAALDALQPYLTLGHATRTFVPTAQRVQVLLQRYAHCLFLRTTNPPQEGASHDLP